MTLNELGLHMSVSRLKWMTSARCERTRMMVLAMRGRLSLWASSPCHGALKPGREPLLKAVPVYESVAV